MSKPSKEARPRQRAEKAPARPSSRKTASPPAQPTLTEAEKEKLRADFLASAWRLERAVSGLRSRLHTPAKTEKKTAADSGAKAAAHFEAAAESLGGVRGSAKSEPKKKRREWQFQRIEKACRIKFPPNGRVPADLMHKEVQAIIEPVFEENKWKLPSAETIRRFRERTG